MIRCQVPPAGWECSRHPGHKGPCAARPTPSIRSILFGWAMMLAFIFAVILVSAPVVHCQVRWDGPRQTPAELAAVLRDCSACQTNAANLPAPLPEDGPIVVSTGSRPGAVSWLDFPSGKNRACCLNDWDHSSRSGWPIYGVCLTCGHGRYSRHYSSTVLTPGVSRSYSRGRR